METLVGLIGVVVGWAAGSSYSFWATRRKELAAAVVATAVLEEELGLLRTRPSAERLATTWNDQRAALVPHLRPTDYQRLGAALEESTADGAASVDALHAVIADLARILWRAHQAFILTPLLDYLRGETLSKRLNAAMEHSEIPQLAVPLSVSLPRSAARP